MTERALVTGSVAEKVGRMDHSHLAVQIDHNQP